MQHFSVENNEISVYEIFGNTRPAQGRSTRELGSMLVFTLKADSDDDV